MSARPTRSPSELQRLKEMPYLARLQAAATEYKHVNGSVAPGKHGNGLRAIAATYDIGLSSLSRHLHGSPDIVTFNEGKRKLQPHEEMDIEEIVLESAARGFPVNLEMISSLAESMGRARDPLLTLGVKWAGRFVERREKLRMHWSKKLSKVCPPLACIFSLIIYSGSCWCRYRRDHKPLFSRCPSAEHCGLSRWPCPCRAYIRCRRKLLLSRLSGQRASCWFS